MAFLVGDIVCVKTTGERVCVLGNTDNMGHIQVRRATPVNDGGMVYVDTEFNDFEVETIPDHAKRQVSECIIKAEAQKELIKAETKFQQELEAEEMASTPARKRSDPSVN